ncbi:hypothetical protein [Mycolicibacterium thermoresistibile]
MIKKRTRALGLLAFTAAAGAGLAAPTMMSVETSTEERRITAQPCINGVVPGNPYVRNCSMPQPGPRIRGQAPDANAIIACRNIPGCLAYYVNYPGRTVWGPYTPPR